MFGSDTISSISLLNLALQVQNSTLVDPRILWNKDISKEFFLSAANNLFSYFSVSVHVSQPYINKGLITVW